MKQNHEALMMKGDEETWLGLELMFSDSYEVSGIARGFFLEAVLGSWKIREVKLRTCPRKGRRDGLVGRGLGMQAR